MRCIAVSWQLNDSLTYYSPASTVGTGAPVGEHRSFTKPVSSYRLRATIKEEQALAKQTLESDKNALLAALRDIGSAGNGALRCALGWAETRYWKAHAALF